jgi:hypothetical protein
MKSNPKRTIINGIATSKQNHGVTILTITKPDGMPIQPGETIRVKVNL